MRFFLLLGCFFILSNISYSRVCSQRQSLIRKKVELLYKDRHQPTLVASKIVKKRSRYLKTSGVIEVSLRGMDSKLQISYLYYQTNIGNKKQRPLVFIFTGVEGISLLERYVANYFVKKGVSVVISELKGLEDLVEPKKITSHLDYSIRSSMGLVDYFSQLTTVDSRKMATIGISLGGFRSLYLLGVDTRVKAGTLVATGSSLVKSIVSSKLPLAKRIRRTHMRRFNIKNLDNYESFLNDFVPIKPLDLLCDRPKRDFFLVMANKDKTVPSALQKQLWQGLGYPQKKEIKHSHVTSILSYALAYLDNTYRFFKKVWNKS